MKFFLIFILVIGFFAFSCKKENTCKNGEFCVVNNTNKVIHFSFGGSSYNDSIVQAGSACTLVGKIKKRPWGGSSSVVYFHSDYGSYYYEVTTCHQVEVLK